MEKEDLAHGCAGTRPVVSVAWQASKRGHRAADEGQHRLTAVLARIAGLGEIKARAWRRRR
jgi:hypothetical protein